MSLYTLHHIESGSPVLIGAFSDLNLSNLTRRLHNCGQDECTFLAPAHDLNVASLLTNGDLYAVQKDGVQWFYGRCLTDPRSADPGAERIAYRLVGPYYYLDKCTYQQQWKVYDTGTSALVDAWKARCILNQSYAGAAWTPAQQITDALTYALTFWASNPPFQIGTITAPGAIPFEEYTDISVAEVLIKMLRWCPTNVVWFDYTTNPPTIHCKPRSALTPATLAIGTDDITGLNIRPRHDLQVPGVALKFEQTTDVTVDGDTTSYESIVTDTAGNAADIETFHATIRLAGAVWSQISERITSLAWPADITASKAWLKGLFPELAGVADGDITFTAAATRTGSKAYLLLAGQIQSWMEDQGITSDEETYVARCTIIFRDGNGDQVSQLKDHEFKAKVRSCSCQSKTYTKFDYTAGEPIPSGLAALLYAAWNVLHYDGQLTHGADEPSDAVLVGNVLRLTGGQTAWATMDAIVQSIEQYADEGQTTITIGPARRLSLDDLLSLQKVMRNHRPAESFHSRSTGKKKDRNGEDKRGGPGPENNCFWLPGPGIHYSKKNATTSYTPKINLDPIEVSKTDADVEIKAREVDILEADLSGFKKRQVLASAPYGDLRAPPITGTLTQITVVTQVQYDSSSHKIQVKTRTAKVLDPGTESGWADITGGQAAECDSV